MSYTAKLCDADGSRAGTGNCTRAAGHPIGNGRTHRGPFGNFVIIEACSLGCGALCEEGPDMEKHVRDEHGGGVVGEQLSLGAVTRG